MELCGATVHCIFVWNVSADWSNMGSVEGVSCSKGALNKNHITLRTSPTVRTESKSFLRPGGHLSSESRRRMSTLLCAGRVPVVPVHTTAAVCGTAVRSSLGLAGLLQWSQTQAYASNVYYSLLSQAVALDRRRVSWAWL